MPEARKPQFKRQESWRLRRIPEAWRRPKGVTSRMRKEKAGWPQRVKIGHAGSLASRGLHPTDLIERRVERESDLTGLDSKAHIVRLSGRLGERKRLALLEKARQLNLRVANPGREETGGAGGKVTPVKTARPREASRVDKPKGNADTQAEGSVAPEEGRV